MRNKLQIFTNFANTLLPHETRYLLTVQQLADQVKLGILERVDYNCQHINQFTPYDPNIDKRKYSHLKNWVQQRLTELDVDAPSSRACQLAMRSAWHFLPSSALPP